VETFKADEESTLIEIAVLLQKNNSMRYFVIPLLSILTCMIFPLVLYWRIQMQASWLYKRAHSAQEATHLLVISRGKSISLIIA
jgi:hypothetical protein